MVKKGSSFAKMGVIIVALLMALGFMGVGVSYWSESLNISGTVETGDWGVQVTKGTCSDPVITCSAAGNVLTVALTGAEAGLAYDCGFTVSNTGSIPVKIQRIDIDKSGLSEPGKVTITTPGIDLGDQIEEGAPQGGTVHVSLAGDATETTFTFTVTISVVQWNQYVP